MKQYRRLTREERYQIKVLLDNKFSIRAIGRALSRSPSSILREVKSKNKRKYNPDRSQRRAEANRVRAKRALKMSGSLKDQVDQLLNLQYSPVQISGALRLRGIFISYETIYRYVYADLKSGGLLYKNLRRRHRMRRSRQKTRNNSQCGKRTHRTWIDDRPKIVEARSRLGDLERDTIAGVNAWLLTIVDRTTKLTWMKKMDRLCAWEAHEATLELLDGEIIHTITNDNGPEFGHHEHTARVLEAPVYFTHPYASWQRGTNENTNGLIRQYFPKGTDLSLVSDEEIAEVEARLNNRPRKSLGFRTPIEVHEALSQNVALAG